MKKLEFRFALYVLLAVAFSCNQLNVKADIARDSKIPGNSEENYLGDDPGDYPQVNDDHSPGISDGDNDEDNDDADIGDEGFYDDDDDDDGDESLGQSLARGSTSSVDHKKDDVRQLNVKNASLQKQQSVDDSEINESGSSEDIDEKSNGSGTVSDEVSGHGLYARQHVLEKEGSSDEEASAEADEIDNRGNDEDDWEDNKNSSNPAAFLSNTIHKPPRNLITKVIKEYKNEEQEENTSSEEQDANKESSGNDSGSALESNKTLIGVGDGYIILKPHPKNATVFGNHTPVKENEEEKVISPGRKDQGDIGNKIAAVSDSKVGNKNSNNSTKSAQRKDTLSLEVHKERKENNVKTTLIAKQAVTVQNTQRHQRPVKKQPITTAKVSVNRAKTKLLHKYLASHVTHSHMAERHRKVKTVSKAAPSTCHSSRILAGHSLKGGARAGHFDVLGETASMHACLQRCCSKNTCDVALLIDGRCYGVACYSDDLCEAIPVPHPHFVLSQLGLVNKGQKRGDIERNQEFHCRYGNLTLRNNEEWSGELCGGVVRCKDGITTVKKCPGIPPKPDDCAKPRLFVKHRKGRCCQMKWKCKARHCIFNNRLIKHGYKLSDPLCTGVVSCYNGYLNMKYCPKIPDRPKNCARPKLKTINIPGKCCKKHWVCSDISCKYDGLKLSHGEKLTDASCAIVMECRNGFLRNKQCPGPPPVPNSCINPTLKVKRIPGECCEMNWTCELS